MNAKNCVISAVGKNSLHKKWMEGKVNFDLHLVVYDDSLEKFRHDAKYACHIKGYKLKVIYKYLEAHPQFKDMYDYFFFPDDDILMDASTINALFDAMRCYHLKIAQPALRKSYFTWPHTLYDRYCKLRYTNFVEMMVPCFSREALQKVLFTFNENETGWGTETHCPLLIDATQHDMAIIDEVSIVHTRPIQSGQDIHNRELDAYLKKFGLKTKLQNYDAIYLPDSVYCCDQAAFSIVSASLQHWIYSEKISSMYMGEDGYFGYVRFLFLLSEITQSQQYADVAMGLLEKIQDGLGTLKYDMSFYHGLSGCCWLIEFLVAEKFLQENPEELLCDIDAYMTHYYEENANQINLIELTGIGKYFLAKYQNRPTSANERILKDLIPSIKSKLVLPKSFDDIRIALDAIEIIKDEDEFADMSRKLERQITLTELSQVERVYSMFRLYKITHDEHLHICVREGMKNLRPQLMHLRDALMLAEILYDKTDNEQK